MIFLAKEIAGGILAVSKTDESIEELMRLYKGDFSEFATMCDKAKKEKLSVRVLLQEMCGTGVLFYDKMGKPHLFDDFFNVSISHTKDFVAVFLHPTFAVGVDLERHSNRAARLRERFLVEEELPTNDNDQEAYCELCWCAKEAIYKMMPDTSIDIFKDIRIVPFEVASEGSFFVNVVYKQKLQCFEIQYVRNDFFSLVWSLKR